MPCYQSTNLPGGFSTTGRTSYKTEAECLQACQEGACCEGTTCSVKPACQCVPAGVCCGPDVATVAGVSKSVCRNESQSECTQRGGTWVVGGACRGSDELNFTAGPYCDTLTGGAPNKVFKGVGTTCTPNPCVTPCIPCCESGLSPSYINVTLATSVTGVVCRQTTATTTAGPYPDYTASKTVTLSKALVPENNPFAACYRWTFAEDYDSQWAQQGYPQRSDPIATYITIMIAKDCSGAACAMWWSVSQSVTLSGLDLGRVGLSNGSTCLTSPYSDVLGGRVLSSALQAVPSGQCFGSLPAVSSSYAVISDAVLFNYSNASHSLVVNGVQW